MTIKLIKTLLLVALFVLSTNISSSYAQTPSPQKISITPEPSSSVEQDRLEKIKKLRDLVATRVAEMKDKTVSSEYSFGTLREASKSSIVIETKNGSQTVGTSDDTQLQIDGKEVLKPNFSTLELGQFVVAQGTKQGTVFDALRVIISSPISYIVGKIVNVDAKNGQITVSTAGGNTTVEIEKTTRTSKFENNKIVKSGLSKLLVGERVHIAVEPVANKNPIAVRILALTSETQNISPSPVVTQKTTLSPTSSPRVTPKISVTPTKAVKAPTPSI